MIGLYRFERILVSTSFNLISRKNTVISRNLIVTERVEPRVSPIHCPHVAPM